MVKDVAGQTFSATIANGDYNWSVNCTDENNNIGTSEIWNLTVNYVAPVTPPQGGGGGGGGGHVIPPNVIPEIPPPVPIPEVCIGTCPVCKRPTTQLPGGNKIDCWSASGLTSGDIAATSSLVGMIPCPDVVALDAKDVRKKGWCNGVEIDLAQLAALRIGFCQG